MLLSLLKFIDAFLLFLSRLLYRERKIDGHIALVTGAAQGIGRSICQQLLKRGATVVLVDINKQSLDKTVDELRSSGTVHGYTCDISKAADVSKLIVQVTREVGEIDILVNNAGIIFAKPMLETEVSEIEKTIGVNLLAHFWTIKNVVPSMKKRGKGIVINIASMAGIGGAPLLSAYCASKAAVISHSEVLRNELMIEKSPVTVHVCMPFMIRTAMNDVYCPPAVKKNESVSNLTSPDECAEIIVGDSLRGNFRVYVPKSSAITAALTYALPTWVGDIVVKTSGFWTLEAK